MYLTGRSSLGRSPLIHPPSGGNVTMSDGLSQWRIFPELASKLVHGSDWWLDVIYIQEPCCLSQLVAKRLQQEVKDPVLEVCDWGCLAEIVLGKHSVDLCQCSFAWEIIINHNSSLVLNLYWEFLVVLCLTRVFQAKYLGPIITSEIFIQFQHKCQFGYWRKIKTDQITKEHPTL